jgi:hypothetical protein
MKCFRVVMQGITREPTDADPDGAGFYTARSLQAESEQHAVESAMRSVRSNAEAGNIVRLIVQQVFEIEPDEVQPHGFIFYDGA